MTSREEGRWSGGGREEEKEEEAAGYRTKNKNPTQRCGEKSTSSKRTAEIMF